MSFDGQWATFFGQMTLRQDGARVSGTYGRSGLENTLEGTIEAGRLVFHYEEANERGTGWFRLRRPGSFAGEYLAEGNPRTLPWQGWRGYDGLWDTSLGRVRLVQEAGRIWGSSELDASVRLEGDLEPGGRLAFRLEGSTLKGGGHFEIDTPGYLLDGEWSADGQSPDAIRGQRAMPRPGLTWLVVLEGHRQRALDDNEFSLGRSLHEQFARLRRAQVRHRYYNDEASLLRWCRQLHYLPEPSVLVVSGHGEMRGQAEGATGIGVAGIVDGLRFADSLRLLHLSSPASLGGQEAARALKGAPFPVSGYTGNADWPQCALIESVYLDMILDKGLPPDKAAEQLPRLVRFADAENLAGAPYPPAGFAFVGPDTKLPEASLSLQPGPMSRSRLH
jgi:hypothetical protein